MSNNIPQRPPPRTEPQMFDVYNANAFAAYNCLSAKRCGIPRCVSLALGVLAVVVGVGAIALISVLLDDESQRVYCTLFVLFWVGVAIGALLRYHLAPWPRGSLQFEAFNANAYAAYDCLSAKRCGIPRCPSFALGVLAAVVGIGAIALISVLLDDESQRVYCTLFVLFWVGVAIGALHWYHLAPWPGDSLPTTTARPTNRPTVDLADDSDDSESRVTSRSYSYYSLTG